MPLMKMVDGVEIAMTPQEEADHLASLPVAVVTVDDFRRAIQARVDATAQARKYDSGITCASYVNSTIPAWAAEAAAFVAWRDAVWTYAYVELEKVGSGQRPQPTIETILAELPLMGWPD